MSAGARMLEELADDHALSLRAVARAVSTSPTSIYLYFSDRDALVLAVMQRCHEQIQRAGADAQSAEEAPGPQLRARLLALAAWAQRNPGLFKVMHESAVSRSPGMPFKETLLAGTADAIRRCMDAEAAPAGDPVAVALDVRAAVVGALSLRINEPNLPWPPLEDQVDRFLTKLVGLRPLG